MLSVEGVGCRVWGVGCRVHPRPQPLPDGALGDLLEALALLGDALEELLARRLVLHSNHRVSLHNHTSSFFFIVPKPRVE